MASLCKLKYNTNIILTKKPDTFVSELLQLTEPVPIAIGTNRHNREVLVFETSVSTAPIAIGAAIIDI